MPRALSSKAIRGLLILCCLIYFEEWLLNTVSGELILLQTLTRHGSRAPNPVTQEICPRDTRNHDSYNVPFAQLTEYGMRQLEEFGSFVRRRYAIEDSFLPRQLGSGGETEFCAQFIADSAERCQQSAVAMGYGLYPDGTGPAWFSKQPITLWSMPKEVNNLFDTTKAACKGVLNQDLKNYASQRGKSLISQNSRMLTLVEQICGVNITDIPRITSGEEDVILGIKDIADDLIFDEDQNLPYLKGLDRPLLSQLRNLSYTMLVERYYDTPRKITYWASDMPEFLLYNMRVAIKKGGEAPRKLISLHAHRELLYAISHLLGWEHAYLGLPKGQIPPGTSLIFELHKNASSYSVQFFEWAPSNWSSLLHEKRVVILPNCGSPCLFENFQQLITSQILKTGTWREICKFSGPPLWFSGHPDVDEKRLVKDITKFSWWYVLAALGLVGIAGVLYRRKQSARSAYRPLVD